MSQNANLSLPVPQFPVFPTTEKGGVISPAEAQFWQEWAERAPGLMRQQVAIMPSTADQVPADHGWKVMGISVGAVLALASFTKYVPGKWKWATGIAAAGSAAAGLALGSVEDKVNCAMQHGIPEVRKHMLGYAEMLEKSPETTKKLAHFLASHISAEHIQQEGLENAVKGRALEFGVQASYLNIPNMGEAIAEKIRSSGCSNTR